ncbi:MAG: sulfatase-like hydrolase/transferase [Planctomycetota bacterium]|nr:sulfatase-like hydrolase/transferase [Planctomycetota bacterium]
MSTRPNILWFSIEDISPRMGCYGDATARTPNLDRLAAEGCRYTRAFSTCGVCAPSRCAIITGMYATSIGAHHMRTTHANRFTPEMPTPYECVPPAYVKCFPEYLRAAGYYCTNNDKTDYQFSPPFSAWDECGKEAHWRHRAPGQPFFAVFNPTITHESGMWEKPGASPLKTDPAKVTIPPYLPDTPKAREAVARHYDNLEEADRRLGEVLKQLEEDGLAEHTIVFIWSDHGEGLPRAKRWPYDQGIRIPLIVRWPGGLKAGSVSDELVSLIDLGPTVLSLCGVTAPRHMQGQPFLGPEKKAREYVFAHRDRHDEAYDMVRAARDGRYKYLRHFYPELPYLLWIPYRNRHPVTQELWRLNREGKLNEAQQTLFKPRAPEELYDTEADPFEMRNLAADPAHRATLERMRGALDGWRKQVGDLGEVPETEMKLRFWPNGVQPRASAPMMIPITEANVGQEPLQQTFAYPAPLLLLLHTPTQGASVVYALDEEKQWRMYREPLRIGRTTTVRAKACRIGYKESNETRLTVRVE